MASEDAYIHSLNEVEAAATGDPAAMKETSGDESSDSTQFYDSDGTQVYDSERQLLNMKEKNKD